MNLDELRPILHAYRQQVQPAWSAATAHPGFDGKAGDPAGQCGVTSAWLQRRLREDHGIETTFYIGFLYKHSELLDSEHCWLEMGGWHDPQEIVIDLTADQFHGLEDHRVICASRQAIRRYNYIEYEKRLIGGTFDEPLRERLAILTEALS